MYPNPMEQYQNILPANPTLISSNVFMPYPVPVLRCQHPTSASSPNSRRVPEVPKAIDVAPMIGVQILISQLVEIRGVISHTVRKLLLKMLRNPKEDSTVEKIMDSARDSIACLTREQLYSELENSHRVEGYFKFHEDCHDLNPDLRMMKRYIRELQQMVNNRINKKLMENQGLGTHGLDERILSLKTTEELIELLGALRQKEYQERINLNFAPYRGQRSIAEDKLDCTRRKIYQVEDERKKRERNKCFLEPRICKKTPYFDAFYS